MLQCAQTARKNLALSKIAPTLTRAALLSKRYFYGSGLSPEILLFAVRLLLLAILLTILLLDILLLAILTLASSVTTLTVRPVRAALTALLTWCRLILVVTTATLTATILATLFLSR